MKLCIDYLCHKFKNLRNSYTYFADVIISVAFKSDMNTLRHESAETLTRRALHLNIDAMLGQSSLSKSSAKQLQDK